MTRDRDRPSPARPSAPEFIEVPPPTQPVLLCLTCGGFLPSGHAETHARWHATLQGYPGTLETLTDEEEGLAEVAWSERGGF